jgi:hypothetical protein
MPIANDIKPRRCPARLLADHKFYSGITRRQQLSGLECIAIPASSSAAPSWYRQQRRSETGLSPYAEAALDSACYVIIGAPNGEQECTMVAECFSIGTLAGAGAIPLGFARRALLWAAQQIPIGQSPWAHGAMTRFAYSHFRRRAASTVISVSAFSTSRSQTSYFPSYVRHRIHFGFPGGVSQLPHPSPPSWRFSVAALAGGG